MSETEIKERITPAMYSRIGASIADIIIRSVFQYTIVMSKRFNYISPQKVDPQLLTDFCEINDKVIYGGIIQRKSVIQDAIW